jgi:uncharacterized membrane protein YgcG
MAALAGIEGSAPPPPPPPTLPTPEPVREESKLPLPSVAVAVAGSSSHRASVAIPLTASKELRDGLAEVHSKMPELFNSALQDAVVDHLHADNESWNSETGVYDKTNGTWNDQKPFHEVMKAGGSYFAHQPSCQPPSVANAVNKRMSVDVFQGIAFDVLKETKNGSTPMMIAIPTGSFFKDSAATQPYKQTDNPEGNPAKLSLRHYDSMLRRVSAIPGSVVETGSLKLSAGVAMGHPVLVEGRIAPKRWYVRELSNSPVSDFVPVPGSSFGLNHVPLPGCTSDNNSSYRHDLFNNESAACDRWLGRYVFLQSLGIVNYLDRTFKDPAFKAGDYSLTTWTKDASSRHHDPAHRQADDIRLDWIMWMIKHFNSVIKTATDAELSQRFKYKLKAGATLAASSSSSSSSSDDDDSERTVVLAELIGAGIDARELPDAENRMYVRVSNQTIVGILLTICRVLMLRHKVGDFRHFFHKLNGASGVGAYSSGVPSYDARGAYSSGVPSYDAWGTMALAMCVKPVPWYNRAVALMEDMERTGKSSADLSVADRLLYFNATKPVNISMLLQVSIIPLSLFGNLKHLEMTDIDRSKRSSRYEFLSGGDIAPVSLTGMGSSSSSSSSGGGGGSSGGDSKRVAGGAAATATAVDDEDDEDEVIKKKKKNKKKAAGAGTAGSSSYGMATPPVRRK